LWAEIIYEKEMMGLSSADGPEDVFLWKRGSGVSQEKPGRPDRTCLWKHLRIPDLITVYGRCPVHFKTLKLS